MLVSLIAAHDRHGVIGADGAMPWWLPADLQRFRRLTLGKPVVMGRRTFEAVGRPLPGRTNVIVTRDPGFVAPEGCHVLHSLDAVWAAYRDAPEVMVAGGAEIYRQTLPRARRLYLTLVDGVFEGDTRFPPLASGEWAEIHRERREADERNPYPMVFRVLERVPDGSAQPPGAA